MNARETAVVIWLAVFVLWALSVRDVRRAFPPVVAAALQPKILVPLTAMTAWGCAGILVASEIGAWGPSLTADTVAWAILMGLPLFAQTTAVFTANSSFAQLARNALGLTVLVEGFVNLYVLPLPFELLLLPIVVFLGLMATVASRRSETQIVAVLSERVLLVIGVALVAYVVIRIVADLPRLDGSGTAAKLGLPVWLTLWTLPFVALLAVWSNYDTAFSMLRWATDDRRRRRRARVVLVKSLKLRVHEVAAFNGMWCRRLVAANSCDQAKLVMREFGQRALQAQTRN